MQQARQVTSDMHLQSSTTLSYLIAHVCPAFCPALNHTASLSKLSPRLCVSTCVYAATHPTSCYEEPRAVGLRASQPSPRESKCGQASSSHTHQPAYVAPWRALPGAVNSGRALARTPAPWVRCPVRLLLHARF